MYRRRTVLASAAAGLATGASGCLDAVRTDTDADGVPDGNDAAPKDGRVDSYVSGDPPPLVSLETVAVSDDTATLRATFESGGAIERGDADRIEVAAEGDTIATIELPFAVGDRRTIEAVPVGHQVSLVLFVPEHDVAAVLADTRVSDEDGST